MPNYYPQYPMYQQNGFFPNGNNGNGYLPQPQPQPQTLQIQNGGFMAVPNEEIAMNYPVAPGNCVTFKIEGKPIVMEKSMGFSQLESPKIERYRLVKESPNSPQNEPKSEPTVENPSIDFKAEFEAIWGEIDALKSEVHKQPVSAKRKKNDDADAES